MKKLGLFILFLCVAGIVGGSRLMRLYNPQAIYADKQQALYLHEKTDLQQLEQLLVDSLHVTESKDDLNWAANLLGWRNFQPGHYKIEGGSTYDTFLGKLARGIQDPISLTIVPGQRTDNILGFLSSRMQFDSAAVYNALDDSTFRSSEDIDKEKLVGRLYPATYDIYWTLPAEKVLERIFEEFDARVKNEFTQRAEAMGLTMNETLALASIIEWEAIHDDEKPKISGLYWNRLDRGMLLQADPTVNYAVDKQRRLYYKDYRVDHPYNTYVHKGLPPGPINNPSLSSIRAALYPADHDYIFMVARPNGYHAFTETYAEHQQKSREWRQYLNQQENEES